MTSSNKSNLERAADQARMGNVDDLERQLSLHPEVLTDRDAEGDTLLGLACRAATGDIALPADPGTDSQHAAVALILGKGADPNAPRTTDGWSPLHTAAMAGHLGLARRLLEAGANKKGQLYGTTGGNPQALALFYAQTEMGQLLADASIPLNLRTAASIGQNLLSFTVEEELPQDAAYGLDFYRGLLLFPAWSRRLDRQEILDEALTWAARNGQIESMHELLVMGADINANPYRGTPLLWATYADDSNAAAWLLDHGADVNLRHDFGGDGHGVGACAIHLAAQFGGLACLRLLLDRGADPHIKDAAHDGDALGWARFSGSTEAVRLIEKYTLEQ